MSLFQSFTQHPASVGESYIEHMRHAGGFAVAMLVGGLACLMHAVFPFLCRNTGSDTIARLHHRMVVNRVSPAAAASAASNPSARRAATEQTDDWPS